MNWPSVGIEETVRREFLEISEFSLYSWTRARVMTMLICFVFMNSPSS